MEASSYHRVTTRGGTHWIVKRDPDDERMFERIAVFNDEEKAEAYLRTVEADYDLDGAIVALLPELMIQFPRGVRANYLAEHFKVRPANIHQAARRLDYDGRARYIQPMDSQYRILAPLGYEMPEPELTNKQMLVYELLKQHADPRGLVALSRKEMGKIVGTGNGNVSMRLETLERKGFIQKVHPGDSKTPSTFQILK